MLRNSADLIFVEKAAEICYDINHRKIIGIRKEVKWAIVYFAQYL